MVLIHIVVGTFALATAAVALYALKGSALHRRSGLAFTGVMLVTAATGALMAVFVEPDGVNVIAALLTIYFVVTALLTVRPLEQTNEALKGLMVAGIVLGLFAFGLAFEIASDAEVSHGIPAPVIVLFGVGGVAGGLLDARLLRAGRIDGAQRLARHAWRMLFALFIATAAFFLGQAQVFPEPVRRSGVLAVPVVVVLLLLLYWLMRLLLKWRPLPSRAA